MILSARDLKVRSVLCALRLVHLIDFSGVDLASPSIKRNLNICQGTIDDAVGLFQNTTNATLIILENDSTMSCKKT